MKKLVSRPGERRDREEVKGGKNMALETLFTSTQLPVKYRDLTVEEMEARVRNIKEEMGEALVILGHHYQREEVFQFADFSGDSLKLARQAAETDARYIVFCGVHFMAETADILSSDGQQVILPDLRAGCSMADMADLEQTERCWETIQAKFGDTVIPVTYVNSSAAIKAFVGRNGGLTCTSSNAVKIFRWALEEKERILFLPDEHLGRNTGVKMGIPTEQMAVYNPHTGELEDVRCDEEDIRVILWKGFCSVHQHFRPEDVQRIREKYPQMTVLVHPECRHEVVRLADEDGSTEYIMNRLENAPPGSAWAIGTEVNLVQRLVDKHKDKHIRLLSDMICPCMTMNRIDLPHLVWVLEECSRDRAVNRITVAPEIARDALKALDRMLSLS